MDTPEQIPPNEPQDEPENPELDAEDDVGPSQVPMYLILGLMAIFVVYVAVYGPKFYKTWTARNAASAPAPAPAPAH